MDREGPGGAAPPLIRKRARPKNSTVVDHPLRTNRDAPPLFVEYVATSLIKPYGKALRPIRAKHLAAVMGSLKTFGFVAPIVIDDNNVVVDGHALVVAAERLGIERIPVVRLGHLSPELVNACRVALNKLAEGGRWDEQAIKLEMIEIAPILLTHDIEIEAMGFSMAEFDLMMSSPPEVEPPDDDVIETDASSISVLGDLWLLGNHRLLCGNALENDAYVRLMDGRKARMAFCDAPYNLKVEGVISGLGQVKHREFAMASGEMSRPEFIAFLTTYMKNCAAHSVGGAVHFACMDWRHILELSIGVQTGPLLGRYRRRTGTPCGAGIRPARPSGMSGVCQVCDVGRAQPDRRRRPGKIVVSVQDGVAGFVSYGF